MNAEVEVIDSARIEPLSYKLAFRIARAAVGSTANDPQQDIIHTNKAISRPEMVEALDLEVGIIRIANASEGDPVKLSCSRFPVSGRTEGLGVLQVYNSGVIHDYCKQRTKHDILPDCNFHLHPSLSAHSCFGSC